MSDTISNSSCGVLCTNCNRHMRTFANKAQHYSHECQYSGYLSCGRFFAVEPTASWTPAVDRTSTSFGMYDESTRRQPVQHIGCKQLCTPSLTLFMSSFRRRQGLSASLCFWLRINRCCRHWSYFAPNRRHWKKSRPSTYLDLFSLQFF